VIIENLCIIDRHRVGATFDRWPAETRFITPSFPTNSIGMLDLNSVAIGVSPAFSLEVDHPTGQEYASHLRGVAEFFELPVQEGVDVLCVAKIGDEFRVDTAGQTLRAKHVIWAAGEFQYPKLTGILGIEHCIHTATVRSYEDLSGDDFIVIGGYESSDPSVSVSTYSLERMREDGFPLLNQDDESTVVPGVFLCGPAVRHDQHVFCFIYKYRQRYAVVAKAIATSLGLPAEELETYRKWGMYLDDLSCCGEECMC